MFTITLAIILGLSPGQSPCVRSMVQECASLSGKLHRRVDSSAKLNREVLFVESRNESPEVELRAVAEALHASVINEAHGTTIRRTSGDLKKLREQRRAERGRWITRRLEVLSKFRTSNEKLMDGASLLRLAASEAKEVQDAWKYKNRDHKNFQLTPAQLLPAEALLEGILAKIGVKDLADIPSGQSRIWENHPASSIAHELGDCTDLLSEFNRKQETLAQTPISGNDSGNFQTLNMEVEPWRQGQAGVLRVRLCITATSNRIYVRLEGSDRSGHVVVRSRFNAGPTDEVLNPSEISVRLKKASLSAPRPLSQDELKVNCLLPPTGNGSLPNWATHPNDDEPLSYLAAKAVGGIAEDDLKGCFVADVPDDFEWMAKLSVNRDTLDVRAFQALVLQTEPFELLHGSDSVVWRPIDAEEVEGARADRRALARFMKTAAPGKMVDTYESCRLYHASTETSASLAGVWRALWQERIQHPWQADDSNFPNVMFALGSISDSGWQTLLGGHSLTADELGIRNELLHLVEADLPTVAIEDPSVPEIGRHPADLFDQADVGSVKLTIKQAELPISMDWESDKQPHQWKPMNLAIMSYVGKVRAEYDPKSDIAIITSDRKTYDASLAHCHYQFATLETGILTIEFPHKATYRMQLAAATTDVSPIKSFSEIDPDLQDQMWQLAQQRAIQACLESGRAFEKLKRESGYPVGG